MNDNTHTPGPWTAKQPYGPGMGWRAGPAWLGEATRSAETEANAKLIAAAPDLLAALEIYVRYFENYNITNSNSAEFDYTGHLAQLARAAIAKATA